MKNELERLVKISDSLDKAGKFDEADLLDQVIQKIAGDVIDLDKYRKPEQREAPSENEDLEELIEEEYKTERDFLIGSLSKVLGQSEISRQANEKIKQNLFEAQDSLQEIFQTCSSFASIQIEDEDSMDNVLSTALSIQDDIRELSANIKSSIDMINKSILEEWEFNDIKYELNKILDGKK